MDMSFGQLPINGKFRQGEHPDGTIYEKLLLTQEGHHQFNATGWVEMSEGMVQKKVFFPDHTLVYPVV
ncbi:MAG TPA: hypothetical protein DEB09_00315 [Candidatus Magasanikbacteria bacterium]|nr:hypothetical protein [Candidatus Magasanikbacteria bacterium]